jgi:hypothetical protein
MQISITNMKTSFIISCLSAAIVLGAPVSDIEKRDDTSSSTVLCVDKNFENCIYSLRPDEQCIQLSSENLENKLSSVAPETGRLCYFFTYFYTIPSNLEIE